MRASSSSDPDDNWYGIWKLKSRHTKGPVADRETNPTRKSVMKVTRTSSLPQVVWGGKVVCNKEIFGAGNCAVSRNKIVIKTHHATGSQNKITYTLIRKGDKLAGGSKFVGKIDGQAAEGTYTGFRVAGSKRKGGGLDQTRESGHPGDPQEREINILEN